MFGSLGWLEIVTLLVVALLIFGPDKLPGVVRDAAQMLRQLRSMAKGARSQIRSELGPEFADFELTDLDPRRAIRKHIIEAWDDEADERPGPSKAPTTLRAGEVPPYDVDAT